MFEGPHAWSFVRSADQFSTLENAFDFCHGLLVLTETDTCYFYPLLWFPQHAGKRGNICYFHPPYWETSYIFWSKPPYFSVDQLGLPLRVCWCCVGFTRNICQVKTTWDVQLLIWSGCAWSFDGSVDQLPSGSSSMLLVYFSINSNCLCCWFIF